MCNYMGVVRCGLVAQHFFFVWVRSSNTPWLLILRLFLTCRSLDSSFCGLHTIGWFEHLGDWADEALLRLIGACGSWCYCTDMYIPQSLRAPRSTRAPDPSHATCVPMVLSQINFVAGLLFFVMLCSDTIHIIAVLRLSYVHPVFYNVQFLNCSN